MLKGRTAVFRAKQKRVRLFSVQKEDYIMFTLLKTEGAARRGRESHRPRAGRTVWSPQHPRMRARELRPDGGRLDPGH